MTNNGTAIREQLRGVCPACFAVHATRDGRLVEHGYRRPQHWHQNVGVCPGAGALHFGTEAGRAFTARIVENLRENVGTTHERAFRVEQGREVVMGRKRIAPGVYGAVAIENPTAVQRAAFASQLRVEARAMQAQADDFAARVAAWQPADLVAVVVEKKTGPLVHWRGGFWRNGKACAGSAMGAMKGFATLDVAGVTCDKCRAIIAKKAGQQ